MKHRIDPKIDCVFKALLGSEQNRNLLLHFLNAILFVDLSSPIAEVEILNPYNDKEFLDDKLSVVDVKAKDDKGRLYQVEIQLVAYRNLPTRMVYTWCDIVSQQLQSGDDYSVLQPVYSIWLLAENLLSGADYAHEYKLQDRLGRSLADMGAIHLLELKKFTAEQVETEEQRWLRFFKDGDKLDDAALPDWMNTEEMRQAMNTLKAFSEKERDYFAYQARMDFLREQRTIQKEQEEAQRDLQQMRRDMEQAQQDMERAQQDMERAQQDMERAQQGMERAQQDLERERQDKQSLAAEVERLKALLAQSNQASQ
jgi:predicted transposase/invertase (TIGR01784 family)